MRPWQTGFSLVVLLTLLLAPTRHVAAQIQIAPPEVASYTYGEEIVFRALANTPTPVSSASLVLQLAAGAEPWRLPAAINPLPNLQSELTATFNPAGQELPAFSTLTYHFEITTPSGQIASGPSGQFQYTDNRFEWQMVPGERAQVHWYRGEDSLAQAVAQAVARSPQHMAEILDLRLPEPVDIYVYADTESLQSVLAQSGHNWVAGRAEPEKGVILVALPPGPDQQILAEQRIPHELMHIALYLTLGENYYNLPAWLNEGLASAAELYPNPEYPLLVNAAYQDSGVLNFSTLCPRFPGDTATALLAYAQSTSFIRFLLERYGKAGMQSLVQAYADGQDCENGAQTALGVPLSELEQMWRDDTFGERLSEESQSSDFIPWLVVILATLAVPLVLGWVILRKRSPHKTERAQL
jgi:hypothetical protein